jgi:hypothetical protein
MNEGENELRTNKIALKELISKVRHSQLDCGSNLGNTMIE